MLLLCTAAHAHPSAAETCHAKILSVKAAKASADERPAIDADWVAVALPDNWEQRWPGYHGAVWYRIDWQPHCPSMDNMLALLFETNIVAGEVYLNDQLLWRDDTLGEPFSLHWKSPHYWRLPQRLLQEGNNTFLIRLIGVAGQAPGLGQVQLGEAQQLQKQYDELWWRNRTLFVINITISLVMGSVFFCIWLSNRKQSYYGWYALMSLCWVLFITGMLFTSSWPFVDAVTIARADSIVLVLYVACFCIFTWRFGEQFLPRLEKVLWIVSAGLIILLLLVPAAMLQTVLVLSLLVTLTIFFANCLQFPLHALRTKKLEHLILAIGLLIFFAVAMYDLLLLKHIISDGKSLTPFSSLAAMLCMSSVLGLRHARNMRRIERFNDELSQGIARARSELETTLAREHQLTLSNTRLQERLQISHDLHDGLGGSLVRMMAMVEQADQPLHNQQFLSLLKLIRDDLRQTIDSGSSSGIKVPTTPAEWLAPLRHRFMQMFDDQAITASWDLPAQWQTPPNALQCLALTRLVEEALINIIKHSQAGRVQLRLWQPGLDQLILQITDNGVGFDVEAVRQAGISIGMRSMHARIAAVGGTLDVQSKPGCTVLTATLQLATTSP